MHRGLGGAIGVIAVLGLSLVTGPASAVVPRLDGQASAPAQRDFLSVCTSADSMNCIVGIEYQLDGEWVDAVGPIPIETIASDDGQGNIEYGPTSYVFETPGLVHEGGRTQVLPELIERDDINGPPYAAYQVQLQAYPHGTDVVWDDPALSRCVNGNPAEPTGSDPCWRAPWLADTYYRYTVRTSTLIPVFAQATVVDMATDVKEIPGGLQISLSGKPGASQWILDHDEARRNDRVDAITYEWGGFFTDVRAKGGSLSQCQGLGIATAYSNGNGGQIPEWDAKTGTLSFGTDGLHYAPDGSVYRGQAEVFVPGPLARCMWNVDPRRTARMEIEVFGDGEVEVAGTKSIAYDEKQDLVKLLAYEFTYSEKEIVARPTAVPVVLGKKACDPSKSMCVTIDGKGKSAKVRVSGLGKIKDVFAVALAGADEVPSTTVRAKVKKGKASLTIRLSGALSKGQVWVVRTASTYVSSFKVS